MLSFFSAGLLLASVVPTDGHGVRNPNVVCPSVDPSVDLPRFVSYHIHVLYWPDPNTEISGYHNAKNRTGARRIRSAFMDHFNLTEEGSCANIAHEGNDLCMMSDDDFPIGPWVGPQFAVYVPPDRFADTVPWIMQR